MEVYQHYSHKKLKHPDNKDFVTSRVNIINKRKVLRISIGLNVCFAIGFEKADRVQLYLNKHNRNYMIIKKCGIDGYKLGGSDKGSFLSFDFRYETPDCFRLSQTVILDYDINNDLLLINIEKLKWNN